MSCEVGGIEDRIRALHENMIHFICFKKVGRLVVL